MSNFLVGRGINDEGYDVASGDGSTTTNTLTDASSTAACAAFISGVRQRPGIDYTVAGTTVTWTTAPPTGTNNILFVYNKSVSIGTPSDGTVTAAKAVIASQAEAEAGTDTTKLVTPQRVAQAIAALVVPSAADIQTFTTSGTWTKPATGDLVTVLLWGGGGGGGALTNAASGGGGGAFFKETFRIGDLSATEAVTVAAGGAGGTSGTNGSAGGNSSFKGVVAYGGGRGIINGGGAAGGGGGGGDRSAGLTGSGSTGGAAGSSLFNSNVGAGGNTGVAGGAGYYGGGGASGSTSGAAGPAGGNSVWGGAGGGHTQQSSPGSYGLGGTSTFGGNGGRGQFASNGDAGTAPGGGGGASITGFSGGAGGRGEVIVITH